MAEPSEPEERSNDDVAQAAAGPHIDPAQSMRPVAAIVHAETVLAPEPQRSETEPPAGPKISKFEAAVASIAEVKTASADKGRRAKARKSGRRKSPASVSIPRTNSQRDQQQVPKVKDRRIMTNRQSFQKDDLAEIVAEMQDKAIAVYEKGTQVAGKVGVAVKDSADAVVTSGKILGAGFKEIGANSVAEVRQATATFGDDLKEFAAIKSPAEFLRLQGKLAGRNFDAAVALTTKNSQSLGALVRMAWAPLAGRISANAEAVSKSA